MKDSEKLLERTLADKLNKTDGIWCIKLLSTFIKGLPDRMVLCRGGYVAFVEVKTTGEKPRRIQELIHDKLRALGFPVFVLDTTEQRDELIKLFKTQVKPVIKATKIMSI